MKLVDAAVQAAWDRGESLEAGAVAIACDPPLRVWGGYGTLWLDGEAFVGLGDRALVRVTGGALGGAAEGAEVLLSPADPLVQPLVDAADVWRAPVVIWRLTFDGPGTTLLGASVHQRGRVDGLDDEVIDGRAVLRVRVQGAAKGLGLSLGRMRTDADQRLIDGLDGGFKHIAAFAEKTLQWGGRKPQRARAAIPNVTGAWSRGRTPGGSDTITGW